MLTITLRIFLITSSEYLSYTNPQCFFFSCWSKIYLFCRSSFEKFKSFVPRSSLFFFFLSDNFYVRLRIFSLTKKSVKKTKATRTLWSNYPPKTSRAILRSNTFRKYTIHMTSAQRRYICKLGFAGCLQKSLQHRIFCTFVTSASLKIRRTLWYNIIHV